MSNCTSSPLARMFFVAFFALLASPPATAVQVRETEGTHGLRFSAFIEPQLIVANKDTVLDRGFSLNDGALRLTTAMPMAEILLDLPIQQLTPGNIFAFDTTRAQAFVSFDRFAHESAFVKVGQFETPFGVERNESIDRFFSEVGEVKANVLPKTHMGLQTGASFNGGRFSVLGQAANPHDNSLLGTGHQNLEYGAQARLNFGSVHLAGGVLYHDATLVAANQTNLLVNLMAGLQTERLSVDVELDELKAEGSDKSGVALLGLAQLKIDSTWDLGARAEFLRDIFANGTLLETSSSIAAGPSFKIDRGLLARTDLALASNKIAGREETVLKFSAGLVAAF